MVSYMKVSFRVLINIVTVGTCNMCIGAFTCKCTCKVR